jgi:hypothetical protein
MIILWIHVHLECLWNKYLVVNLHVQQTFNSCIYNIRYLTMFWFLIYHVQVAATWSQHIMIVFSCRSMDDTRVGTLPFLTALNLNLVASPYQIVVAYFVFPTIYSLRMKVRFDMHGYTNLFTNTVANNYRTPDHNRLVVKKVFPSHYVQIKIWWHISKKGGAYNQVRVVVVCFTSHAYRYSIVYM